MGLPSPSRKTYHSQKGMKVGRMVSAALTAVFFIIALLYASVGFGGGSSYSALLALSDVDYRILQLVSLVCNILVVAGGTWHFHREGQVLWPRIWPFFAASVPCALLGGWVEVPQIVFYGLLGCSLMLAGMLMAARPFYEMGPAQSAPVGVPGQ